jgi:hypothetical protein
MTGEANWLLLVMFPLGFAALLALWFFGVWVGRGYQWRKTKTTCPASGATVDVTLVTDASTGRIVDVARCAAFEDPNDVRCQKRCIETTNVAQALREGG